jgi:thiol-disulfide isomerase/thioredoxin
MKNIRFLALTIIYFISITASAQDTFVYANPIQTEEVIINGHIDKYKGVNKTGSLIYLDAVTRIDNQEVFSIDSVGNFKMSINLVCPTMIAYMQVGRIVFFLYLVPGETYNITINERGTHVFTGENSTINNQIFEVNEAIRARFKKDMDKLNHYYLSNQTDFQSFEKFCDDLAKRKLAFTDDYCKKNAIGQKVGDLIKLDLSFEPACNLIGYRLISSGNTLIKRKDLPANFYQHLYDRFQINNPKAIACKSYINYISNIRDIMWEDYYLNKGIIDYLRKTQKFSERELFMISKYFIRDTTITKTNEFTGFFDKRRGEVTQFTNKYLTQFLLDSVDYFPAGSGRDLIISQAISLYYLRDQTNSPSSYEWNRIDSLISNKNILSYLKKIDQFNQAKAFKSVTAKTNLLPPLLKSESDKVFEKLIEKYNGKVVYIDFWATWCGPCRQEIPYSKILSSHFDGQDVVFLYLCCQSDKKNWVNTIKSEQMTGEHYLLSSDEYNILSKTFSIRGVPTYVLIDRKGTISDKNAFRPSDGPATIAAINKLLKK